MAAPSPITSATALVTYDITVNGSPIKSSYQVVSIEVTKELNRIPTATIIIRDGSAASQDFPISDSSDFVPGNPIVISAGYQSTNTQIFSGIIVQQGLRIDMEDSVLEVVCKDKAVKMTVGRKSTYMNSGTSAIKDSDAMSTVIGTYSGLSATVKATTVSLNLLYQHYATDWDFVLSRAEANGMIVAVDDGAVNVNPPTVSGSSVLGLTYGQDLMEMEALVDSTEQYASVQATSWDPGAQAIVQSSGSNPSVNTQGNLTSSTLSSVVGLSKYSLQSAAMMASDELQAWASALQMKSWMARMRGRVKFQGSALAKPDKLIDIAGVGARYNGALYIRAVRHTIARGDWITEADFGIDPTWFSETNMISAPPAAGLLPPVHGLQIGVVKQTWEDPLGHFRVQLTLPLMQNSGQTVWARMATFYASSGVGAYFYPEANDEVIVGFLDDDPRSPVILGMVHSSKNAAPYTPDNKNTYKAFVSKEKVKIEIDDVNKVMTLTTPGNNQAVFSDKDQGITFKDQNGNEIQMNSSGITIKSAKDITIQATGKIDITANQNITASASGGDVSASGVNVKMTAQAQFQAAGNAQAQVSSSGQTAIKGSIVMIN